MLKKSKLAEKLPSNLWLSLNPSCTLFAPQNFAQALFSISIGTAVIPRRNGKQRLFKIWGAGGGGEQIRYFMGDVQVAYRP